MATTKSKRKPTKRMKDGLLAGALSYIQVIIGDMASSGTQIRKQQPSGAISPCGCLFGEFHSSYGGLAQLLVEYH